VDSYISALSLRVTAPRNVQQITMPWLDAALAGLYGGSSDPLNRTKAKGAYLQEPYSPDQIGTLYRSLTHPGLTAVALFSYGCAVNAVARSDTANPHRDSILMSYLAAYTSRG
jgi:hypothetical protein